MAKQRLEVNPVAPPHVSTLVGGAPAGVKVVSTAPGNVTLTDRLKAYWHTIFIAFVGVVVTITTIAPDLDKALNLFPHTPTWDAIRYWTAAIVTLAGIILTRLKSNEVWVQGSAVPSAPSGE